MDNEKNKIDYSNNLRSITNEYHDYNEYNRLDVQNNNYKELSSFKEYNTNKEPLKKRAYAPVTIAKLLSSTIVITLAVVMGTSFIFGPSSVVEKVFLESYENSLFVEVMFSEYSSDDNLELVIHNDFTDRVYQVEAYGEEAEEETLYFYSNEVLDLTPNATYSVSIVSGLTTLYKDSITIPPIEEVSHTEVLELYAEYAEELISVSASFSYFNSDDYVLLQLEKDGEIIESITFSEVEAYEDRYYYSNSFSVIDVGTYFVNLYVNEELVSYRIVDVIDNTIHTSVDYFGNEYADLTMYYYLGFIDYRESEEIKIELYQDDSLINSAIITDISQDGDYYSAEGTFENINDGKYKVVILANDNVIYEDNVVIGYIWETALDQMSISNENKMVYLEIPFIEYNENEGVKVRVVHDDQVVKEIEVSDVVQDEFYYFYSEFEVSEYGFYEFYVVIDDTVVFDESADISKNISNTTVSDVRIYPYDDLYLVIVDIDSYDTTEALDITLYDNYNAFVGLVDLEVKQDVTGAYFASFVKNSGEASNAYSYKVFADSTALIKEGEIDKYSVDYYEITPDGLHDGSDGMAYIALYIQEGSPLEYSFLLYNKNNESYPQIHQTIEYMEGTRFYYSFDDLDNGDYVFILFGGDENGMQIQYWEEFTLSNGG